MGCGFMRFNISSLPLKIGFDFFYEHFKSEGIKELTLSLFMAACYGVLPY
jgi:hypothetical protein